MQILYYIKKIRTFSLLAFIIPFFALNSCMLLYKLLGDIDTYGPYDWNKSSIEYTYDEMLQKELEKNDTFVNCPKHNIEMYYILNNEQKISAVPNLLESLNKNNQIKSILISSKKTLDYRCVKNRPLVYLVLKKFPLIENILIEAKKTKRGFANVGFSKIKNPYFYGEVSISRTARYFPATYIFKPLIILSAFCLLIYWKNNLNTFNLLKKQNSVKKFSQSFYYIGVLSCIFLILHATFLGIESDLKIFKSLRKIIIILFIFFEVFAQILLTQNLFKSRLMIKNLINPIILKIKIFYVFVVFIFTCFAIAILVFGDPSSDFKHILEWNYFSFLLIYYILSRLLWKI